MNHLPTVVLYRVQDYLWGTTDDWKYKLNITHYLPKNSLQRLRVVKQYQMSRKIIESEDCVYCSKCGEKNMWFPLTFYHSCCLDCKELETS